jgi:hypothetical protein
MCGEIPRLWTFVLENLVFNHASLYMYVSERIYLVRAAKALKCSRNVTGEPNVLHDEVLSRDASLLKYKISLSFSSQILRTRLFSTLQSFFSKLPYFKMTALYRKSIYIFPETKLCGLVPKSYIHLSVSDFYIPIIGLLIWLQKNRPTDPGNI